MLNKPIYLDFAATTPVDPRVWAAMGQVFNDPIGFANPSSGQHSFGLAAKAYVDQARETLSFALKVAPKQIIWTSGATEANNLAIKGFALANQHRGRHLITVNTEHKAVLDCFSILAKQGFSITCLTVDDQGRVDPAQLAQALSDETILVSLMHVNNETGVIQDIAALAKIVHQHGARLHVDAVQALGKIPFDFAALDADLVSVTAHKIYGPKGVGALILRDDPRLKLVPLLHGGNQEKSLRAGTLAPHQLIGFAKAAELAVSELAINAEHIRVLNQQLLSLFAAIPQITLHSALASRVPHIVNVGVANVEGAVLAAELNRMVAVSNGSACNVNTEMPSHVLLAQGVSLAGAKASLRFSLGKMTTAQEITDAVNYLRFLLNK